jgi:hypothetical protein
MLRRRHFELPSHAAAWIRMAKPDGPVQVDFSLLQGQIAAAPTRVRLGRSISFDALPPVTSQRPQALDIDSDAGALSRGGSAAFFPTPSAPADSHPHAVAADDDPPSPSGGPAPSPSPSFASAASTPAAAGGMRCWFGGRLFTTSSPIMVTTAPPADS